MTSTFLSLSLIAAKVRSMVTVAGSPWGTNATKIPAARNSTHRYSHTHTVKIGVDLRG